MYKLGEIMLISGVLMFIVGGIGVMFSIISKSSSIVSLLAVLALILIGAGTSIKKKYNKKS